MSRDCCPGEHHPAIATNTNGIRRRTFLGLFTTSLALGAVSPSLLWSVTAQAAPRHPRILSFESLHTGERARNVTYWEKGQYLSDGLAEINHLLRDWRTDEVHTIDPSLLDLLYELHRSVGNEKSFQVISGYRSPKTNAMLAAKSNGVAKRSLHMQGKAIDIALPGTHVKALRKAALALQRGGVGYYPSSGFIHVDTGRVRQWGG